MTAKQTTLWTLHYTSTYLQVASQESFKFPLLAFVLLYLVTEVVATFIIHSTGAEDSLTQFVWRLIKSVLYGSSAAHSAVACSLIPKHQNLNELRRVKTTRVWKIKEIKSSQFSCSVKPARRFSVCEIKFFSDDGIVHLVLLEEFLEITTNNFASETAPDGLLPDQKEQDGMRTRGFWQTFPSQQLLTQTEWTFPWVFPQLLEELP